MFTYLTFVLALILALCTGVSSGQCPDNCNCYEIDAHGTSVNCSGQQLLTIPIVYPETGFL
ncbi:hypothetical protein DPMN_161868 [Dreissena polymorpha]|uniref:LRRNT domain-containing protein n=1 Tax=Dreissena polymorpha TaxID=45954 RepID=A0A9D4ITS6_DREPO|nr:hypothetical protein DPMN_161868 [Dreissena polymorpha]